MEDDILDYETNEKNKPKYRKFYLLIESILFFPIFWLVVIGGSIVNYNKNADIFIETVALPALILFYLVSPLIRFIKKESTPQLAFLYLLQYSFFLISICMLFYFESIILGKGFGIGAIILFIIIPHLELKKHDTSKSIHLFLIFINLAFFLSIIGFWIFGSSSATANNPPFTISLLGSLMSFALLFVTFALAISNWEKYFYFGYSFPRLLFAISLGIFQILHI